ncbi:MAG: fibronectin type III domain-containing protein, partial [Clostridia bacterium]|nr:fibronectin type III domain-containing protein [Clostridia bacterium]
MDIKWLKKIGSLILAVTVIFGLQTVVPVAAAADEIEIVLTDVTQDDPTTLLGEAKVKVSVRGAVGNVFIAQLALEFDGELKYKSIDFLKGENNPPQCSLIAPNAALANNRKELLPSIVATESMTFTDDLTDLFILTFAGNAGDSVTVSVDSDKASESYVTIDEMFNAVNAVGEGVSVTAVASASANEGIPAVVKLKMDVIDDIATKSGEDYADCGFYLTITNEENGSTFWTAINNIPINKGGHRDGGSSVPTFIVENTVISGNEYTVELSGAGYRTYRIENYDFSKALDLTNSDFVPGDVNMDGEVDDDDKLAFAKVLGGNYDEYGIENADFNRDGRVTDADNIFGELPEIGDDEEDGKEEDETKKTAPKKMKRPTLTAGIGSITVQWEAPADGGSEITGYIIKYGVREDRLIKEEEIEGKSSKKKVIKDLSEGQKYYVQIAAVNEIGTGEFSPIEDVTT